MKSVGGILLTFLFLVSFSISHPNVPLQDAEDQVIVSLNIKNPLDVDVRDARVKATAYELETTRQGRLDVEDNRIATPILIIDEPGVEPDYYPLRVTIRDDQDRNIVKHVWAWLE